VDFTQNDVLVVSWSGSSSSSLHWRLVEKDGKVKVVLWIHTPQPHLSDLRFRTDLVVIPKGTTWEFGPDPEPKFPGVKILLDNSESVGGPDTRARLKGMKAALADLEAGKLKLKSFPLADPAWQGRYVALLKQKYGVTYEVFTGYALDTTLAELRGYNAVMRMEIEHRFGEGVLAKLQKQVIDEFARKTGPVPAR
jgi:hypothetical protein